MDRIRTRFLLGALISATSAMATNPSAAADTWTQLDDGTTGGPARYHTQAVYDMGTDRMLFCAGMEASNRQGDVWAWDFATSTWSQLADDGAGPASRQSPCAVFVPEQGVMVIHGGEHDGVGPDDDTWRFDCATNTWTELTPSGAITRDSGQAIYDPVAERMVIYSGEDHSHHWLPDVRTLSVDDPSEWIVLNNGLGFAPPPRTYFVAAYDPESYSMIVFGGQGSNLQMRNDLWKFDLADYTWTQLDDGSGLAPSPRYRHSGGVLVAGRKLTVFGGFDGTQPLGDTWQWDLDGGGWTLVDPGTPDVTPAARSAALSAVRRSEELVIFGGNVGSDLRDLWSLRDEVADVPLSAMPSLATLRCWPNPATEGVTVHLVSPSAGPASLRIHDASGRLIRQLWQGDLAPAGVLTNWDGLDSRHRAVPAGTYFVTASTPTGSQTTGISLVR